MKTLSHGRIFKFGRKGCVSNPDSQIRIRSQHFWMNNGTDPDPGFWWPKVKNFTTVKNVIPVPVLFVWSKIAIYLSLGLHTSPPALQNLRFPTCFLFLLVFFALPGYRSMTWLNRDPIRIRIRNTAKKEHLFQASAWKDGIALPREAEVPSQIQRKEAKCGIKYFCRDTGQNYLGSESADPG